MSGDGWKDMPGQPRACAGCGHTVKLRGEALWLSTGPGKPETWHVACRAKRRPWR